VYVPGIVRSSAGPGGGMLHPAKKLDVNDAQSIPSGVVPASGPSTQKPRSQVRPLVQSDVSRQAKSSERVGKQPAIGSSRANRRRVNIVWLLRTLWAVRFFDVPEEFSEHRSSAELHRSRTNVHNASGARTKANAETACGISRTVVVVRGLVL